MFSRGDKLTAATMNHRVQEMIDSSLRSSPSSLSASRHRYIVFRQEASELPSNGNFFPTYYIERPLRFISGICFGSGLSSGYMVSVLAEGSADVLLQMTAITETFVDGSVIFLPGDGVRLRIDTGDNITGGFQCSLRVMEL